jgi:hypothetical protein
MLPIFLKKKRGETPRYLAKPFFDKKKRAFYSLLRRAIPECRVFPDIDLSALLTSPNEDPKQRQAEIEALKGRKVAFALFDAKLKLTAVVELRGEGEVDSDAWSNADLLRSAGIVHVCWDLDMPPTAEQILCALAPPASTAAPSSPVKPPETPAPAVAASRAPAPSSAPRDRSPGGQDGARGLTLATLEGLTPNGHIRTHYPHIWERICVLRSDPKRLSEYFDSLMLQDRGGSRTGFRPDALLEIADIMGANARFVEFYAARSGWSGAFVNR